MKEKNDRSNLGNFDKNRQSGGQLLDKTLDKTAKHAPKKTNTFRGVADIL